jgi:hypothetical protein
MYTDNEMLDELRRVAATIDGPLSRPKFTAAKPRISAPAITARFGSWLAAIEAAGLPPAYAFGGMWRNCPVCGDRFRFEGGEKARKTCGRDACRVHLQGCCSTSYSDGHLQRSNLTTAITLATEPRFGSYTPAIARMTTPSHRITPRQRELVDLLVEKRSIAAAAKELGMSIHTARAHVKAIVLHIPNPHGLPAHKLILAYFESLR